MPDSARLTEIRDNLVKHFSLEELRSLCADLSVDFDDLRGETKTDKADALLKHLDHRSDIFKLIAKLAQLRPNVAWREIDSTANAEPPFKGLPYFDVADAPLFFGREKLTAQLIARLLPSPTEAQASRFLAVIGASGSGKSSLVRAGVVATLWRDSARHGIAPQHTFVLTPTDRPLRELAARLTRAEESTRATTTLMDDLREDSRSLDLFIAKLSLAAGQKILIVVDQFEELFTACKDEAERKAFIDNLLYAASSAHNGPVLVLLTLRADFYEKCAPYADLRALLEQRQVFIGPMSEAELRTAIQQPAQHAGLSFEPGLVELLLREAGAEPGALPLLSHALLETWRNRRGRTLSLQGYTDSGGVHGAIAKTADATFAALVPADQAIAKRIFLALTELGEGTQDTRRRAALNDLTRSHEDAPRVEVVLNILADARLITTERETAEVAHEALIREWGQLRGWLDEDRAGLRVQRQLEADAREWLRLNRDADVLYRGAKLAQAQEWAAQHGDDVDALTRAYLGAAVAAAQHAADEREVQRQRELAQERARVRTAQMATVFISVFLVAALVASVFAFRASSQADQANRDLTGANQNLVTERNRANEQATIAKSQELGAQALANQERALDLSFLLSVEALRSAPTFEARSDLLDTLQHSPRLNQYGRAHTDSVRSVSFSPDGKTLASGSDDSTVILWDVSESAAPKAIGSPLKAHTDSVWSVAFSPDGKTLVSGSGDNTLILWDVSERAAPKAIGSPLKAHTGRVWSVAFSPDGKTLVSGSGDNTLILWDVSERTAPKSIGSLLKAHTSYVWSVAFSPDGKTLASGSADSTVILWDVSERTAPKVIGSPLKAHTDSVWSVAFSPDGKTLASGSLDNTLILWDVSERTAPKSIGSSLKAHTSYVWSVAFSPDGKTLASSSADSTVILWDVSQRAAPKAIGASLKAHKSYVLSVAFSPDGKTLASGSADSTVILWDVSERAATKSIGLPLKAHTNSVRSVAFSPVGMTLASGSFDSNVILWDVSERAAPKVIGSPLKAHTDSVWSVAFSPDGKTLASGSWDSTVILWDVSERTAPKSIGSLLKAHTLGVLSVAFSPDGKTLASGSADSTVILWDVSERTAPKSIGSSLKAPTSIVSSVAFSPDSMTLASGSFDSTLILWDVSERTAPKVIGLPLKAHTLGVLSVAFSPDGKTLASGSIDGTVILWDVSERAAAKAIGLPLKAHTLGVLSVAFSPDGKTLASGSDDNTVILWDVSERTAPKVIGSPLKGHTASVNSVVFSPDGKTLASGSDDNSVILWDVDVESWIHKACHIANRNLTQAEWQRYLGAVPYRKTCPGLPDGI